MDAWLDSRLKRSHRALGFGEPLRKLDFELCDLMRYRCHPGQDVTRQQTQRELERQKRVAWKQYWHADGARYHLSNRQMSDAITVMEQVGMARQVPTPPFPLPASYGASSEERDDYLDAVDRGETVQPSPELSAYLDALDQHLAANYDAQVIPRHKLWTNDGWLITPEELDAALPHAPSAALDRRQRPIPWWTQWLDYLNGACGHGGIRVR